MFKKARAILRPRNILVALGIVAAAGATTAGAVAVNKRLKAASAPRLNAGTVVLALGECYQLEVSGSDEKPYWETSDPSIASVNENGLVTAESEETGVATVVGFVGDEALECEVVVVKPEALTARDIELAAEPEPVEEPEEAAEPEEAEE